jgi:ketosteroid isomerase-like protein
MSLLLFVRRGEAPGYLSKGVARERRLGTAGVRGLQPHRRGERRQVPPHFEFHDFEGAPQPIRRGIDEWQRWARDVAEAFGEFILEPQELLDFGDQVVAVVVMGGRGKGSGVDLQQVNPPFTVVWTVRDGKVVRGAAFRSKPSTPPAQKSSRSAGSLGRSRG